MKYLDADLDPSVAQAYLEQLSEAVTRPWTAIEVCGGQAQHFIRAGIDRSLPDGLSLVHGPGCPDCLIPVESIELAMRIAEQSDTIVCTSSEDLLCVPGRSESLADVRSRGGDVRVVYSPLGALALARRMPEREVVYLSVGFETTAPAAAAAVLEAERVGLTNFSMIVAHMKAAEAVRAVLAAKSNGVQAVLAPGHVSSVIGLAEYDPLAAEFGVPIVVTGPEPVDLLDGLLRAVRQLERGSSRVENQYERAVRKGGNPQAQAAIATVFETAGVTWRGLGQLGNSGLKLRERFGHFDASARLDVQGPKGDEMATGPCRDVLIGRIRPAECPEFGGRCSPDHAIGPAMLTLEGACAAYYRERCSPIVELVTLGGLKHE
jgi:hydrogenase expression/formation protein HypD